MGLYALLSPRILMGSSNPFSPLYAPGAQPVYSNLPPSGPIISWVGDSSFIDLSDLTGQNYFTQFVTTTQIAAGDASNPAIADVLFRDVSICRRSFQWYQQELVATGAGFRQGNIGPQDINYRGFTGGTRDWLSGIQITSNEIQEGFLSYRTADSDPVTQPLQPPGVINFGGAATYTPRDGSDVTTVVTLDQTDNAAQVATKVAQAVNTSWTPHAYD